MSKGCFQLDHSYHHKNLTFKIKTISQSITTFQPGDLEEGECVSFCETSTTNKDEIKIRNETDRVYEPAEIE